MKKNDIEELGHNYPFDPKKSSFSIFEERYFSKILISISLISVLIVFLFLYTKYDFTIAFFISLLFGFIWVIIIGPIVVKLMIRRREKLLKLQE